VVDVRGEIPRVVRQGAVSAEELRTVVPDLLVPEVSGS
jgi:tRNA A37 threonylcarbamoyladenosine synthetase subunit TsaC/SUA5/YrdC